MGNSNYWEARTLNSSGELLGELRNHLTELSNLSKNTLVLIVNAGDGLILGEFLRRISNETIYAIVESKDEEKIIKNLFEKPASGIIPNVVVDKNINPEITQLTSIDRKDSNLKGYSCFLEKEIYEQSIALENAMRGRFNKDNDNVKAISSGCKLTPPS